MNTSQRPVGVSPVEMFSLRKARHWAGLAFAFGNLLFVLPSLFFSLRTWLSGKGWFSVVTHSAWNGVFFSAGCYAGEFTCTAIESDISATVSSIALSGGLLGVTYLLYRRRENKELRHA